MDADTGGSLPRRTQTKKNIFSKGQKLYHEPHLVVDGGHGEVNPGSQGFLDAVLRSTGLRSAGGLVSTRVRRVFELERSAVGTRVRRVFGIVRSMVGVYPGSQGIY